MKIVKIVSVSPLENYVVALEFSDGLKKEIDLEPYLGGEVFEPIKDIDYFRTVRVAEGERTISWPNGVDIDPYTLYYGLLPTWDEEDDELVEILKDRREANNTDMNFIPTDAKRRPQARK